MKQISQLFYVGAFVFLTIPGFSQKYTTPKDTVRLNKEYVKLSNDMAQLHAKLSIAQNELPGYQAKAREANEDAAKAATVSSDQASKATSGTVSAAKTAKHKANKSLSEAKDARSAKNKVNRLQNTITRYQLDIRKKEQRLEALAVMRAAIYAKS